MRAPSEALAAHVPVRRHAAVGARLCCAGTVAPRHAHRCRAAARCPLVARRGDARAVGRPAGPPRHGRAPRSARRRPWPSDHVARAPRRLEEGLVSYREHGDELRVDPAEESARAIVGRRARPVDGSRRARRRPLPAVGDVGLGAVVRNLQALDAPQTRGRSACSIRHRWAVTDNSPCRCTSVTTGRARHRWHGNRDDHRGRRLLRGGGHRGLRGSLRVRARGPTELRPGERAPRGRARPRADLLVQLPGPGPHAADGGDSEAARLLPHRLGARRRGRRSRRGSRERACRRSRDDRRVPRHRPAAVGLPTNHRRGSSRCCRRTSSWSCRSG